jgi:serine/threonine protein kinase
MVLGVGGFGITYLAQDYHRNQICAIKEYFPGDLAERDEAGSVSPNRRGGAGAFQDGLLIFRQETEILRLFAGEEGIVGFFRAFQENNTLYYVMEYLDGTSLSGLTKSLGEMIPIPFAAHIISRAGLALDRVHQKGILHLDVSPENIFILKSGLVKLIDFGAARYYTGCENKGVTVHLKPDFAPPEQYSSHAKRGPWTDVYALGATFYYMTTGRKIPAAPIRQEQSGGTLTSLAALAPDAGPQLSAGVEKATRLNPTERYQTVPEFIRDAGLERLATEGKTGLKNQGQQIGGGRHSPGLPRRQQPYLLFTNGVMQGNKWQITDGAEITLGRSSQHSNIVIPDLNISRVHCLIRYDWETGRFFIRDQSSNGTFTSDGRRFAKGMAQPLSPGEEFYLYARTFMIRVGLE